MKRNCELLPDNADGAVLLGRVHDPELHGPCLVTVDSGDCVDVTPLGPTMSRLLERTDLLEALDEVRSKGHRWPLEELASNCCEQRDVRAPRLLSPVDLHVVKAAGVTFVESMLERVVEERAMGDSSQAQEIRDELLSILGGTLSSIRPGSPEAADVKEVLIGAGLWSAYLEVGIGPDPEVFTKAPVLSTVGACDDIGVRSSSAWNNPEPEVVLIVRSDGAIVGVTLGNDVNLRDIEGRSALLLGEAKDNNASCSIGPFIRVIDDGFTMDDVRTMDISLSVEGADGFVMHGRSSMRNISRDPEELVRHVIGAHHQYPDGFALFTGTLFAPTQDRYGPGQGFTHAVGDIVQIHTPLLGRLVNRVVTSEAAAPWTFGLWSLMSNLGARQLL